MLISITTCGDDPEAIRNIIEWNRVRDGEGAPGRQLLEELASFLQISQHDSNNLSLQSLKMTVFANLMSRFE